MVREEVFNRLFLTFDVEDFVNTRSIDALCLVLKSLRRHHLEGLFFITGHMAEKLQHHPNIINMLGYHEIGYHSTSHSVHPNIFEYTDLPSYQDAYQVSLIREVSHINSLSGEIEGNGGIGLLRDIFPHKKIQAFRAPGFSWSPPHLDALRSLGIKYDFSTNLYNIPIFHKGISFFPFPFFIDNINYDGLVRSVIRDSVTVLDFHPHFSVNQTYWDNPFLQKYNPQVVFKVPQRTLMQRKKILLKFEILLNMIRLLRKSGLIETGIYLTESEMKLNINRINLQKTYHDMVLWPKTLFNYKPKYIYSHLLNFLGLKNVKYP